MARGWESKSVETQIENADGESGTDSVNPQQPESVEMRWKREGLMLQRSRILQEMETARNPRYRDMLDQVLNHVEAELAGLSNK